MDTIFPQMSVNNVKYICNFIIYVVADSYPLGWAVNIFTCDEIRLRFSQY